MDKNTLYWMWFQQVISQGTSTVPRLLKRFSSIEELYRADRGDYCYVGAPSHILDALCDKSLDNVTALAEQALRYDGWILTPDHPDYPTPFRHLYSIPLVLYGRGLLPHFEALPVIGMVGMRKSSPTGDRIASAIAAGLAAAGCPIISGGAVGIDRAAHEGALYAGGSTVDVQVCGLDVNYPTKNVYLRERILDAGGALISEYPPGTEVRQSSFQVRNRLISGLSWGICVVEAGVPSGALITARTARDQGKDVFAVPGNVLSGHSVGCHLLIRDGATLVTNAAEILQEYQTRCGNMLDEEEALRGEQAFYEHGRIETDRRQRPVLADPSRLFDDGDATPLTPLPNGVSDTCRRVYEALETKPISVELLCEKTAMPIGEIFSVLTELEIYGCVRNYPGQQYAK